jgi:F0F1-type ATP synthase membrane subunit b/b'
MTERDDEGLAGVLDIALTNSMALSINLMSMLMKMGVISADDLRNICNSSATSIENGLGPAKSDDNEATSVVRQYAAKLKGFGAIGGPKT